MSQSRFERRKKASNKRALKESNLVKRHLAFVSNGKLKSTVFGRDEHARLKRKRDTRIENKKTTKKVR